MKIYLLKDNNHLKDNGYELEEQWLVYDEQLEELLANPRWYLDNFHDMTEYRVSWHNYRYKTPVIPGHMTNRRKAL